MRKIYTSKKYCYYCNVIRRNYQNKKNKIKNKIKKKNKIKIRKKIQEPDEIYYKSLELKKDDINKIITDTEKLSKKSKGFKINFRKLEKFDLGLCLIFTSLLEYFKEKEKTSFNFRKDLMPKNKNIRNMFIQTGIFKILCDKSVEAQKGKISILKYPIENQEQLKKILLEISEKIVDFSIENSNITDNTKVKKHLNKIFSELLLNIKSHANTKDKVYLASDCQDEVIKFAILDQGIGFTGSIKNRNGFKDFFPDLLGEARQGLINKNYVKIIFESNREKYRNYSGENIRRGNGTKRLEESIRKCKGAKMQIVSKKDFYELNSDESKSNYAHVKEHRAIGTLINLELPIKEFLKGVENDNI